jgi:hypothetical protein
MVKRTRGKKMSSTVAKPRDILLRAIEVSKKIKNAGKRHNFFEIATIQPRNGVGMLFQRRSWNPKSYYEITKVIVQPDGKHGRAWGLLTWNGKVVTKEPVKIPGLQKKGLWRYIPEKTLEQRELRQKEMQELNLHLQKVREQNSKFSPLQ